MSTRSRKRQAAARGKAGGALSGMRAKLKRAAGADGARPGRKRSSALGTVITILLLLAAVALFFYRRR